MSGQLYFDYIVKLRLLQERQIIGVLAPHCINAFIEGRAR